MTLSKESLKQKAREANQAAQRRRDAVARDKKDEHDKYVRQVEKRARAYLKERFPDSRIRKSNVPYHSPQVYDTYDYYEHSVDTDYYQIFRAYYMVDDLEIEVYSETTKKGSKYIADPKWYVFQTKYAGHAFDTLDCLGQLLLNEEAAKQR